MESADPGLLGLGAALTPGEMLPDEDTDSDDGELWYCHE